MVEEKKIEATPTTSAAPSTEPVQSTPIGNTPLTQATDQKKV